MKTQLAQRLIVLLLSASSLLGVSATFTSPPVENSLFPGYRTAMWDNPIQWLGVSGWTVWDVSINETTTGFGVETAAVAFTEIRATHKLYVNSIVLSNMTGYSDDHTVYSNQQNFAAGGISYDCENIWTQTYNNTWCQGLAETMFTEAAALYEYEGGGSWVERDYHLFEVCGVMTWNFGDFEV